MKISGVYKIVNNKSEKFYIGSSTDIKRRKTSHFSLLRNGKHKNPILQKAFDKYGEDSFEFIILETCLPSELISNEQKYLDELKPDYNCVYTAGGFFRVGYKMTDEEKNNLSKLRRGSTHSKETKDILRNKNLGKKLSKSTLKKLSTISKTNWSNPEYVERIKKLRKEQWDNPNFNKEHLGWKKKPIIVTDLLTEIKTYYLSKKDFCIKSKRTLDYVNNRVRKPNKFNDLKIELMDSKHCVVLVSGGQDSITSLHWAKKHIGQVDAICFHYGQNHSIELDKAQEICDSLGVTLKRMDITEIMALSKSALTEKGGDVNKLNEDGLPSSFVPNRNQMFLTIAHSYAQLIGADSLVTGVCQTDYSGYPDCRNLFIQSLDSTLTLGSGKRIPIHTPLMFLDKADTFNLADELGCLEVILHSTMTCYNGSTSRNDWGMGCGECPACKLRANGYKEYLERKERGEYEYE